MNRTQFWLRMLLFVFHRESELKGEMSLPQQMGTK